MTNDTLLFRQINASWVQQGRVTSQAFRPMPKDQGLLSVYDGDLIDAEGSWTHFTCVLGWSSAGVMALSVQDILNESLTVAADPEAFPEHVVVNYLAFPDSQIVSISNRLGIIAGRLGWQYMPSL